MTLASRQECPGFFGSFCFYAPLFDARDDHGGVERFQACFLFGDEHPSLANQRDSES
jgi:hypothetical protein